MAVCRHDLEEEWCSICLGKTSVVADVEHVFEANYDGQCSANCGERIASGQRIAKMSDGTYRHEGCT